MDPASEDWTRLRELVRQQLTELPEDCRRLLHGRGGHFPKLEQVAIDWFQPVLLVTLYAESAVTAELLAMVVAEAESHPLITTVIVQRRHLPGGPKECLFGKLPPDLVAQESGLRFHLNLERNQNHGFFLDMKPGRDWLRQRATGKRVLNLFAYTCSLSVSAIAGGAESVVNLDMASSPLSTGRSNHQLNFDPTTCRRASYLAHNLFKSWGRLRRSGPFDLVVIDPPSRQAGSFVAERDYRKIVRNLPSITHPGSEILACLNSPHLGEEFLQDEFSGFPCGGRLPGAPGFEDQRESASLKCLTFSTPTDH